MRSINLSLGSIKIVLIAAVVALCACSKPEPLYVQSPVQQQQVAQPQQQPQAAPQVVYQQIPAPAQQDNSTRDMLLGGVAGYMLGSRGGGGGAAPSPTVVHNTTVVNRTIVNKPTVVRQTPNYSRRK